ncbi:GntR family transcriptional regulator [Kineococcus sp. TBRC 1896]|uniref:GntR family transcriptional regulator n=1 Tax=Kineococcus mangrovi TaxID=1660183 RepID=A0ABV4HWM1_9ACTN
MPSSCESAPLWPTDGEPLSLQAYRRISRSIILGDYPQGMRLHEKLLTEQLQISRVPLRECFPLLERDGYIETEPRRSAVVSTWTRQRVVELFDVRLGLEVEAAAGAARLAADGRPTDGLLRALAAADDVAHTGDPLGTAEASTRFHEEVVEFTGNRLMVSLMRPITQWMTWLFFLTSQRDTDKACEEHHELVEAIASGKERLASSVAYAHIEAGREPTLAAVGLGAEPAALRRRARATGP